jgi:protocatechuate 3,4-dioxygenase beta subunit
MINLQRRKAILGLAGLALAGPVGAAKLLTPTPPGSLGPFYPQELPLDDDNDLTRVVGRAEQAKGVISELSGRVLDLHGRPVRGASIQIWQCDALGRYHHPRESGGAPDPNFQGFGQTLVDAAGRYRFRTIRPVPYPGRTPHIHAAVFAPGNEPFVTQIYVAGEQQNASDFLFSRIPEAVREHVLAAFQPTTAAGVELSATFDLVLGLSPQA